MSSPTALEWFVAGAASGVALMMVLWALATALGIRP